MKKNKKEKNKISFSRINTYNTCPRKFKLSYIDEVRPNEISSSLIFGKAIDDGLNELLTNKDLVKATNQFFKSFTTTNHNGEEVYLPTSELVSYLPGDFQEGILNEQDALDTHKFRPEWVSLRRKGILMIEAYNSYVLPQIEEVIVLQKRTTIKLKHAELEGTLDLIAKINGKVYLLDNKTSSSDYNEDSATLSQQLSIYYALNKDKYGIEGVGFIVMKKNIWERKTKSCSVCGFDGSGSNFRTCNNTTTDAGRCNGEWAVQVNPKCYINLILNDVNEGTIKLAMESVDGVSKAIKNEIFPPNFQSCTIGKGERSYRCQYFNFCHKGDSTGLCGKKKDD